jgi:hypothetical protein
VGESVIDLLPVEGMEWLDLMVRMVFMRTRNPIPGSSAYDDFVKITATVGETVREYCLSTASPVVSGNVGGTGLPIEFVATLIDNSTLRILSNAAGVHDVVAESDGVIQSAHVLSFPATSTKALLKASYWNSGEYHANYIIQAVDYQGPETSCKINPVLPLSLYLQSGETQSPVLELVAPGGWCVGTHSITVRMLSPQGKIYHSTVISFTTY